MLEDSKHPHRHDDVRGEADDREPDSSTSATSFYVLRLLTRKEGTASRHKPLPRSSPKSTPRPPPPPARSQRTCIPISSLPSSPPTFTHLLAKNAYFIPLAPGHHPARARRTPTHARRSSCGRCEAWSQMRREKEIQRMSWEIRARLYVCASD